MELLADRFRIIAGELYGCGKSPPSPGERPMWLDDQVAIALKAADWMCRGAFGLGALLGLVVLILAVRRALRHGA
jgi:hypothetical protein